jgi:hypothetical protein
VIVVGAVAAFAFVDGVADAVAPSHARHDVTL